MGVNEYFGKEVVRFLPPFFCLMRRLLLLSFPAIIPPPPPPRMIPGEKAYDGTLFTGVAAHGFSLSIPSI